MTNQQGQKKASNCLPASSISEASTYSAMSQKSNANVFVCWDVHHLTWLNTGDIFVCGWIRPNLWIYLNYQRILRAVFSQLMRYNDWSSGSTTRNRRRRNFALCMVISPTFGVRQKEKGRVSPLGSPTRARSERNSHFIKKLSTAIRALHGRRILRKWERVLKKAAESVAKGCPLSSPGDNIVHWSPSLETKTSQAPFGVTNPSSKRHIAFLFLLSRRLFARGSSLLKETRQKNQEKQRNLAASPLRGMTLYYSLALPWDFRQTND